MIVYSFENKKQNTKEIRKNNLRGDLSRDTLDYFLVKGTKFARFYFLPKTTI